jgi:hypothetical protein
VKRSVALLVGGSLALWVVIAYPARVLWGDSAVVLSGVAGLLCLVPTAATLVWSFKSLEGSPERQLAAVMGGTALRMVFVIAAGMVLYLSVPYFHEDRFWYWVIAFYLFTLALETSLLLKRRPAADGSAKTAGTPPVASHT